MTGPTTATATGARSPLRAILDGFAAGAGSLDDVAARTGLPRSVVRAGADHLVRLGYLQSQSIAASCPSGGCRTCPTGSGGSPGCGAAGPAPDGPQLVALTLSRRP